MEQYSTSRAGFSLAITLDFLLTIPMRQRKFFTTTNFDFRPDRLSYSFGTLGGSKQLSIDYADISVDSSQIEERRSSYLYIGLVLFGLGSILGAYILETEQRISGFNYAAWGLIFLVAYFVERKKYIVFAVGSDPLIVLNDKRAPEIISQIDQHRKERFVEFLQRPDFIADEQKRQGLVSWLIDRRVLSEDEIAALTPAPGVRTNGPRLH